MLAACKTLANLFIYPTCSYLTPRVRIRRIRPERDVHEQSRQRSGRDAARFVNHASVKPNAEIVRVVHRGLLRVVIVAREAIAPGGQVLVDYGDAYWRASGVAPRPLPRILADVGTDRYRF